MKRTHKNLADIQKISSLLLTHLSFVICTLGVSIAINVVLLIIRRFLIAGYSQTLQIASLLIALVVVLCVADYIVAVITYLACRKKMETLIQIIRKANGE